ncbi:MAG: hypothetical protein WCP31_09520, partial [Chloroflexales bacterium]
MFPCTHAAGQIEHRGKTLASQLRGGHAAAAAGKTDADDGTLFTVILWVGSMRVNGALAITFTLLLIGFILLSVSKFGFPFLGVVAGYELMP